MIPEDLGPAVQRALLTQELKRLRANAKLTQEEVAQDRGWSVSKFTRIENGQTPVGKSDLEGLLRLYGVADDDCAELVALAAGARRRGWWLDFYGGQDKAAETFFGYEDGASSIRSYQSLVIPGLLQTEGYTRALMGSYNQPQSLIDKTVYLRRERQRRAAARAPEQHYLVDEVIFQRPVGDVLPDQLRHLLLVAKKPAVDFRIVPVSAGFHIGLRGPFVVLGFGRLMPDILYLEGVRRDDLLIAEQETVGTETDFVKPFDEIATYIDGFNDLQKIALDPESSIGFLEQVLQKA